MDRRGLDSGEQTHEGSERASVEIEHRFDDLVTQSGIRMGFAVGRPDLLEKIAQYSGQNSLPITAVVAAKASLLDADLVPTRKKTIGDIRVQTLAWLKSEGYAVTPSESNCFMLDTGRSGKEVLAAMQQKNIYVGRVWPAWPTYVRITVGTRTDMEKFRAAYKQVLNSSTAGLEPLPVYEGSPKPVV